MLPRMSQYGTLLVSLLLAAPAAGQLTSGPDSDNDCGPFTPGRSCYHKWSVGETTDSTPFGVSQCPCVSYGLVSDGTAAVTVQECLSSDGTCVGSTNIASGFTSGTLLSCRVPSQAFHNLDVTAAPASGDAYVTVTCHDSGTSTSLPVPTIDTGHNTWAADYDGDGFYEEVWGLADWDGDGSVPITCTAKDTPHQSCKVAGEILRNIDFVDDMNALLHYQTDSKNLIVNLHNGIYGGKPCWDYTEWLSDPSTSTTALMSDNPASYDEQSDAAYSDCVVDIYGEPLFRISSQDVKLTIQGKGWDLRYNPTDSLGDIAPAFDPRPNGRMIGTTIAMDTGAHSNDWFVDVNRGFASDRGYIASGYQPAAPNDRNQSATGANMAINGSGKGAGRFTMSYSIVDQVHQRSACVCNNTSCAASTTGWVQTLDPGDVVISSTTIFRVSNAGVVSSPLEVASVAASDGGNCPADSREVFFGNLSGPEWGIGYSYWVLTPSENPTAVGSIRHFDDGFFNSRLTLKDLTIEPQDYFNEGGGDCTVSDKWKSVTEPEIGAGLAGVCDTARMIRPWSGLFRMDRVAIKNWHHFSIDNGPSLVFGDFNRVVWIYGQGISIFDTASPWRLDSIELRDTEFASGTAAVAFLGGYLSIKTMSVSNVEASSLFGVSNMAGVEFRDLQVINSQLGNVFNVGCNVRNSVFDGVFVSGVDGGHGGTTAATVIFTCADSSLAVTQNRFSNFHVIQPGQHREFGSSIERQRMVLWNDDGHRANYGNTFEGFRLETDDPNSAIFVSHSAGTPDAEDEAAIQMLMSSNSFNNNVAKTGKIWAHMNRGSGALNVTMTVPSTVTGAGNLERPLPIETGGTASSGASATLTDTGIGWSSNQHQYSFVRLRSGRDCGDFYDTATPGPVQNSGSPDGLCDRDGSTTVGGQEWRYILSNTTDTITVDADWIVNPASGDAYEIYKTRSGASQFDPQRGQGGVDGGGTATLIASDNNQASVDDGDKVCASQGLTCISAFDVVAGAAVANCQTTPATSNDFIAICQ